MARADSTVRVNIIGDARSLQDATRKSEKAVGGIGKAAKVAGGLLAGAFAADKLLDFTQSALSEFDRVGDATFRLQDQLGKLSGPLIDAADGMERLGGSRQDVLELQARFADLATAAGVADEQIAGSATSAAEAALALSLIKDVDAATILDQIGKAAGGSERPLKELGISLSDAEVEARALAETGKDDAKALTDAELASARLALIMEKLAPTIAGVTGAEADLETRQRELQARFETFTGKVGEAIEGPLNDFLAWLLATGETLGWAQGQVKGLDKAFDGLTGSVGDAVDQLRDALRLLADISKFFPGGGVLQFLSGAVGTRGSGPVGGIGAPHPGVTLNVQGGSPEVVEQAVKRALVSLAGRGPTSGSGV